MTRHSDALSGRPLFAHLCRLFATATLAFGAIICVADSRSLIGAQAQDFALRSVGGPNVRLSEHRGEVVVVAFWSSRCNPCRDTLKELSNLQTQWSTAGLTVLGVNVDDDTNAARQFAQAQPVAFPMLMDPTKKVARAWQIEALPYVVALDRDGRVRLVRTDAKGRAAPGQDFASRLRRLLDE